MTVLGRVVSIYDDEVGHVVDDDEEQDHVQKQC